MRIRNGLVVALGILVGVVGLMVAAGGVGAWADETAESAGRAVFDANKCSMCHSVSAVGVEAKTSSEKLKGPDLSGYEGKADFETIAAYIRKAGELDGKTHKKEFKGTDEELQALVDWLAGLEAQE